MGQALDDLAHGRLCVPQMGVFADGIQSIHRIQLQQQSRFGSGGQRADDQVDAVLGATVQHHGHFPFDGRKMFALHLHQQAAPAFIEVDQSLKGYTPRTFDRCLQHGLPRRVQADDPPLGIEHDHGGGEGVEDGILKAGAALWWQVIQCL